MSGDKDSKQMLIDILYNRIDAGLHKKDAYELADSIENLIEERINNALDRIVDALGRVAP